jgi:hypothetical protein
MPVTDAHLSARAGTILHAAACFVLIVSWCLLVQLLEFSRTVLEDLSNYDPTAAWPVALDEFVEHIRRSAKK